MFESNKCLSDTEVPIKYDIHQLIPKNLEEAKAFSKKCILDDNIPEWTVMWGDMTKEEIQGYRDWTKTVCNDTIKNWRKEYGLE